MQNEKNETIEQLLKDRIARNNKVEDNNALNEILKNIHNDNFSDYELELSFCDQNKNEKKYIFKANIKKALHQSFEEFLSEIFKGESFSDISDKVVRLTRYYINKSIRISDIKFDIVKFMDIIEDIDGSKTLECYNKELLSIYNIDKFDLNIRNYYLACAFTISFTRFANFYEHELSQFIVYYLKDNFGNINDDLCTKLKNQFIYRIEELSKDNNKEKSVMIKRINENYESNFIYDYELDKSGIKTTTHKLDYKKFYSEKSKIDELSDNAKSYRFLVFSVFFYRKSELEQELDLSNNFTSLDKYIRYFVPLCHSLSCLQYLRVLNLSDNDFSHEYSLIALGKAISVSTSIEVLKLQNCKIGKESLRNFVKAVGLSKIDLCLKELDLSNNNNQESKEFFEDLITLIKICPALDDLSINKNNLGIYSKFFFDMLNELSNYNCISIKRLYINSMNINIEGFNSLGEFLENKGNLLELISLSDNEYNENLFKNPNNKENPIRLMSNIREIAMLKCKISNLDVITEFLVNNKNIESLILFNNDINDPSSVIKLFSKLSEVKDHKLLNIDLGKNNFEITKSMVEFFDKNLNAFQNTRIKAIDLTCSELKGNNKVPDLTSSFIVVKDKDEPYNKDQIHFDEHYKTFYEVAMRYQNNNNKNPIQLVF